MLPGALFLTLVAVVLGLTVTPKAGIWLRLENAASLIAFAAAAVGLLAWWSADHRLELAARAADRTERKVDELGAKIEESRVYPTEADPGEPPPDAAPKPNEDHGRLTKTVSGTRKGEPVEITVAWYLPNEIPLRVIADLVEYWREKKISAPDTGPWTTDDLKGAWRAVGKGNWAWQVEATTTDESWIVSYGGRSRRGDRGTVAVG